MGLPPSAELAWRWTDVASWITKRDADEPSFAPHEFIAGGVAAAARDDSVDEGRGTSPRPTTSGFAATARDPKKLVLIDASNHRFTDRRNELRAAFFAGLDWIAAARRPRGARHDVSARALSPRPIRGGLDPRTCSEAVAVRPDCGGRPRAVVAHPAAGAHARRARGASRARLRGWVMLACALTGLNVAVMGLYDVVAFRHTRARPLERWRYGAVAFAWSNFLTLGPLAGPAIRLWLYRGTVDRALGPARRHRVGHDRVHRRASPAGRWRALVARARSAASVVVRRVRAAVRHRARRGWSRAIAERIERFAGAARRRRRGRWSWRSSAGSTGCWRRWRSSRACAPPARRGRCSASSGRSSRPGWSGSPAWCRAASAAAMRSGSRGCRSPGASTRRRSWPTG